MIKVFFTLDVDTSDVFNPIPSIDGFHVCEWDEHAGTAYHLAAMLDGEDSGEEFDKFMEEWYPKQAEAMKVVHMMDMRSRFSNGQGGVYSITLPEGSPESLATRAWLHGYLFETLPKERLTSFLKEAKM